MSVVDQMIEMLSGMNEANVEVHAQRCIAVRNRHAACQRCIEACTSGALAFEDGVLNVYPGKCIGCGTCATACPTSAIEVRSITDDELTTALKRSIRATKGHPVIACNTLLESARAEATAQAGHMFDRTQLVSYNEQAVAEVPCLGRIDESILVGAAAYKSFDITLVHGTCETCPHATGGALCTRVAASARSILAAFGSDMDVAEVAVLPTHVLLDKAVPASNPHGDLRDSRRAFLASGKDATTALVSSAAAEKTAEVIGEEAAAKYWKVDARKGTLDQNVPTRRARLYNYLKHLGEPVQDQVVSRVIGTSSINAEACTSCRMCTVFCPTGALFRVDEDGAWGVAHRPSICVQCRLCENLCPQQAITVSGSVPARQFMGKEVVFYEMAKPEWEPNKPDSMYEKFHSVVGKDLEMCMF